MNEQELNIHIMFLKSCILYEVSQSSSCVRFSSCYKGVEIFNISHFLSLTGVLLRFKDYEQYFRRMHRPKKELRRVF
jgi:hypothetical protein